MNTQDMINAMLARAVQQHHAKMASYLPRKNKSTTDPNGYLDLSITATSKVDKSSIIAESRDFVLKTYREAGLNTLTPVMGRGGFNVTWAKAYTPINVVPLSPRTLHCQMLGDLIALDFSPFYCAVNDEKVILPAERNVLAMLVSTASTVTNDAASWQAMRTLAPEKCVVVRYEPDTSKVIVVSKAIQLSDDMRLILTNGTPAVYTDTLRAAMLESGITTLDAKNLPAETISGYCRVSFFTSVQPVKIGSEIEVLLPKLVC